MNKPKVKEGELWAMILLAITIVSIGFNITLFNGLITEADNLNACVEHEKELVATIEEQADIISTKSEKLSEWSEAASDWGVREAMCIQERWIAYRSAAQMSDMAVDVIKQYNATASGINRSAQLLECNISMSSFDPESIAIVEEQRDHYTEMCELHAGFDVDCEFHWDEN